jgi:hypothetical protein
MKPLPRCGNDVFGFAAAGAVPSLVGLGLSIAAVDCGGVIRVAVMALLFEGLRHR